MLMSIYILRDVGKNLKTKIIISKETMVLTPHITYINMLQHTVTR